MRDDARVSWLLRAGVTSVLCKRERREVGSQITYGKGRSVLAGVREDEKWVQAQDHALLEL